MKSGTFWAPGKDFPAKNNPLPWAPLIGLVAIAIFLEILLIDHAAYETYLGPVIDNYVWAWIILVIIGITGIITFNNRKYTQVYEYEVSYSNNIDDGGDVLLRYTNLKNSQRKDNFYQKHKGPAANSTLCKKRENIRSPKRDNVFDTYLSKARTPSYSHEFCFSR